MQRNSEKTKVSYLFNKSANHFGEEKNLSLAQQNRRRTVSIIHKKDKLGSSDDYTAINWFKINTHYIRSDYTDRLYRVIILAGEIMRLCDIHNSPKYRIYSEEKSLFILSKGIENPMEYYDYIENRKIFSKYDFEGMGRQFFIKTFLAENDNQGGNWYLGASSGQKNQYFYTIDHGQCFSPWVFNFYNKFYKISSTH
jgi:hypothetical protein